MEMQSFESIERLVNGLIRRSPNIRLTTLYTHSRKASSISAMGSVPLIDYLVERMNVDGHSVSRWTIAKTVRMTEDSPFLTKLDKTTIIDSIYSSQSIHSAIKNDVKCSKRADYQLNSVYMP